MREEVRDWFDGALKDLEMARLSLGSMIYNWALFTAHQAVEKALKALIIAKRRRVPPKTHDLVELVDVAGMSLEKDLMTELSELSPYYSISRYPNAGLRRPWERISRETAERLVEAAEKLVEKVGEELKTT